MTEEADDALTGGGRQPLQATRVLDLSGPIGAYCGRLLADLGADVIKVEPPDGDDLRRRPPFNGSVEGPNRSLLFAAYHANERGITLDVRSRDALPLLVELGSTAEVVLCSPCRRSPLPGFDRDRQHLSWARPDAIVAAITAFGLTGPMRDFRATAFTSYAIGGGMHRVGPPDGPPVAIPGRQQWDEAGLYGALGVVAALLASDRVGGQVLDLAVHEVAAAKDFLVERYDVQGMGGWGRAVGVGLPPSGTWQCADGPFEVSCIQTHHWVAFLDMLDHPVELEEPALADALVRRELWEGLSEEIARLMAARSRVDLFERGQSAGLPCNPRNSPGEFSQDVQARARGLFPMTEPGELGGIELPWGAFKSTPDLLALRHPAPSLGQHNVEIYVDELGHSPDDLASWKECGLV